MKRKWMSANYNFLLLGVFLLSTIIFVMIYSNIVNGIDIAYIILLGPACICDFIFIKAYCRFVVLDKNGIKINKKFFEWSDVKITLIIRKMTRGQHVFLAVGNRYFNEYNYLEAEKNKMFIEATVSKFKVLSRYYKDEVKVLRINKYNSIFLKRLMHHIEEHNNRVQLKNNNEVSKI